MLNLDPRLVDQDKIRHEKRKKFFRIAVIPLIFLFIIAVFFLRTGVYDAVLSVGYNNGNYEMPKTFSSLQAFVNIIEPYLTYYNRGHLKLLTAKTIDDLTSAEDDFQESLKNNPPEVQLCSIYVDLSYTLELEGDLSVESKDYDKAVILYNRAESILYENNCATKDSSSKAGKDELAKKAKERIEEKRKYAIDAMNNVEDGDDGEDKPEEKVRELTEAELQEYKNNQEAIKYRSANALRESYGMNATGHSFDEPNF